MSAGNVDEMQMLTHDVRNLLTGLNLVIARLERTADHSQQKLIKRVNFGIKNLIDVSSHRLEEQAGRMGAGNERVCIAKIASDASQSIAAIQNGLVNLNLDTDGLEFIQTCRTSLFRIIYNLILNASNALTSQIDGQITLTLEQDQDFYELNIADNGPGLPPHVLDFFFPRYDNHDQVKGRIGLGIPTSVQLAKKLQGTLLLKKTGKAGTVFTLRIPKKHNTGAIQSPYEPAYAV